MIIYLNSTDQAAQDAALVAAEVCQIIQDEDGVDMVVPKQGYTVDTIGIIYNTTDPLNPIPTVGWFANIMAEFTSEQLAILQPTAVPNNPVRMFAGVGK